MLMVIFIPTEKSMWRKVAIPDSWFSRGYVECSFGQVMLHFRSFGHIMLQESSQCLHTQTESKAVTVVILCFIWPDYGSTYKDLGYARAMRRVDDLSL
jgi:hypothetical protein